MSLRDAVPNAILVAFVSAVVVAVYSGATALSARENEASRVRTEARSRACALRLSMAATRAESLGVLDHQRGHGWDQETSTCADYLTWAAP